MNSIPDLRILDEKLLHLPPEQKVEILWDVVRLHQDEDISTEDVLFFRRIAFKLNIDKSLIDIMLQ